MICDHFYEEVGPYKLINSDIYLFLHWLTEVFISLGILKIFLIFEVGFLILISQIFEIFPKILRKIRKFNIEKQCWQF